jgi:glycosyltransferase involved in cell wall biosynthesis
VVEAMASGLPVVASDLAVHREVCGDAAEYFPRFDSDTLARRITVVGIDQARLVMIERGKRRSLAFRWDKHVDLILNLLTKTGEKGRSLQCA